MKVRRGKNTWKASWGKVVAESEDAAEAVSRATKEALKDRKRHPAGKDGLEKVIIFEAEE
jgi:hypothetical protein